MRIAVTVIFIIVAIVLAVIVMMQEGKGDGLSGAISGGGAETYWSKNKGKSKEAMLLKITVVLGVLFMGLALLLCSKFI